MCTIETNMPLYECHYLTKIVPEILYQEKNTPNTKKIQKQTTTTTNSWAFTFSVYFIYSECSLFSFSYFFIPFAQLIESL